MNRPRPGFRLPPARRGCGWLLPLLLVAAPGWAQTPNLTERIERPLRYRAEGQDILIENGAGRFNRALYGPNDAFRIDAGEAPEFALHLPGKGGLLRLGVASPAGTRWLAGSQRVVARYRAGEMVYEIRDPALGAGVLTVTVLPLKDTDGLMLRAELSAGGPVDLVWAFGGASGADVAENPVDPGASWNFTAQDFAGGTFKLNGGGFEYTAKAGVFIGTGPGDGRLALGDAAALDNLETLLASKAGDRPVLVGRAAIRSGVPAHVVIQRAGKAGPRNPSAVALTNLFKSAEKDRAAVAAQAAVDTPDPYVNAGAAALVVAADALWQDPSAVAAAAGTRTPLPGWAGPLALDAFGWFDRSAKHLTTWAGRQNADAAKAPTTSRGDPAKNLSADDGTMLLSAGSLPVADHDMNQAYADALLRHLRWTGDAALARQLWPVLQRHFVWEKRLFDRDGLYEGYAAFPAADGLAYGGGGSAAASAMNYLHQKLAVQVATLIGQDTAPYRTEMTWIADAVTHDLWLPDRGWYAEYKDVLGLKRAHPGPALWSLTRLIDSELPTPQEAYQATRYADGELARIPVRGPGVPEGDWFTLPTSNWLGGEGLLNRVAPAEAAHAALAFWQAGRADDAWKLWKGVLLDSMYLGKIPGNLSSSSNYDPYAGGATVRDDGDTIGIMARATIEGLFGILPDAMAGELLIRPGYPSDWDHASLRTPYLGYDFKRESQTDKYVIEVKFPRPMRLRLAVRAHGDRIVSVTVNGKVVTAASAEDAVGEPRVELKLEQAARQEIVIRWGGNIPATVRTPTVAALGRSLRADFAPARLLDVSDPQGVLRNPDRQDQALSGTVAGTAGPRTIFAKLRQGDLTWWQPVALDVRPAVEVVPSTAQDAQRMRFRVRNNTTSAWERPAVVEVGGQRSTLMVRLAALSESPELALPAAGLLPGAIPVRVELGDLGVAEGLVTNWQLNAGANAGWRTLDLGAVFNDQVGQIFRNEYLRPRPERASLQIPKQGIGTWAAPARTFAVDDTGLRRAAANGDQITLPQGIPFRTPSAAGTKNVAFTSRWENYPAEVTVPMNGRSSRAYLLLAGSTNPMQARLDNAEIVVTYRDGTTDRLTLQNPANWWPVDQDFFTDDYAFRFAGTRPLRLELGTGKTYVPGLTTRPNGGAATVIDVGLNPDKTLQSLTLRTLSNEVVVGLMAVTLAR